VSAVASVLAEVAAERGRQDATWGEQNHADGTGRDCDKVSADRAREACERSFREGWGSWSHILREEVAEAFAESDPVRLREELIQVAAVAAAWVEAIDRRTHAGCARRVESGVVHYNCGISVECGDYPGGVYAEHVRRLTESAGGAA